MDSVSPQNAKTTELFYQELTDKKVYGCMDVHVCGAGVGRGRERDKEGRVQ